MGFFSWWKKKKEPKRYVAIWWHVDHRLDSPPPHVLYNYKCFSIKKRFNILHMDHMGCYGSMYDMWDDREYDAFLAGDGRPEMQDYDIVHIQKQCGRLK